MRGIITLLSDFGVTDGYVASMKGTILKICPAARLVDITHEVPPQDIQTGAFILATACHHFPEGTAHLAVVDPGVGTSRRPLLAEADGHYFVGPDNGLFSWIFKSAASWRAWEPDRPEFWRREISHTFHGRDIFAPLAAHLAAGAPPDSLGSPCDPLLRTWFDVLKQQDGSTTGQVIHVDHFGNAITSISPKDLGEGVCLDDLRVDVPLRPSLRVVRTYGEAAFGEAAVLVGSHGFFEIAVNGASAARGLGLERGTPVQVRTLKSRLEPPS